MKRNNKMNYAHEDKRFQDAVNEYVHGRIAYLDEVNIRLKNGERGIDSIDPSYCDLHNTLIIFRVWKRCLTESDHNESETHCIDAKFCGVGEDVAQLRECFDSHLPVEMERQILLLIDEKQRMGERG